MAESFFEFQSRIQRQRSGRGGGSPPPGEGAEQARAAAAEVTLTVSQLTARVDRALRAGFPAPVSVRGEVSNFKHHGSSGHMYFSLKDAMNCVDCVMFRSDAARVRFVPQDGMEIIISGRVAAYGQRSRYQIYATSMSPVGQGALELAFRQMKAKLEGEGLFAAERKKRLPRYPMTLAMVTSRETAALQDMLRVLRGFPWLRLMLYHVSVQGEGSAEQMAAAIADLNRNRERLGVDVILLSRGGGSLEDLWEFNEECVARAIVGSAVPVVTGIGHEVDVSIADLVADYHAHTPTQAAQVVADAWRTAREDVDRLGLGLRRELRRAVEGARTWLRSIERHDLFRRPGDRIERLRQVVDDREKSLAAAMGARLAEARRRAEALAAKLGEHHPRHAMALRRERIDGLRGRLDGAIRAAHQRQLQQLMGLEAHLNAIGPEQVLKRGYTITVQKKTGAVVRSAKGVRTGERVVTRFADGAVESTVEDARQMPLFE